MQEFIAFNEQRAEFYWWMSSLFSKELIQDDLNIYFGDDMAQYLSSLAMTPKLKPAVVTFQKHLLKQQERHDGQLELAADFCGLFLSTPKTGALPYASIYIGETGLLNDKPAQEMGIWLERFEIAQRKDFNEPLDHLSIQLDFMGNLVVLANHENEEKQESMMTEQETFLESMLLTWLPAFQTELASFDQFGFYKTAGDLLLAFVNLDRQFLKGD